MYLHSDTGENRFGSCGKEQNVLRWWLWWWCPQYLPTALGGRSCALIARRWVLTASCEAQCSEEDQWGQAADRKLPNTNPNSMPRFLVLWGVAASLEQGLIIGWGLGLHLVVRHKTGVYKGWASSTSQGPTQLCWDCGAKGQKKRRKQSRAYLLLPTASSRTKFSLCLLTA